MNTKALQRLFGATAFIFLTGVGVQSNAAYMPVVEYATSQTPSDGHPFTLGYQFTTTVQFDINALGYWDDGLGNDHQVGIWDSAGNLITSTTVSGTDTLQDHFRYADITSLLLAPGTYTIGGEFLGGLFPDTATGVTTLPGFTWVTDEQIAGSGLSFPTFSTTGGYGDNGILLVTMSASTSTVPEPGTLALLGLGLAGLAASLRRKQ